MHCQVRLLNSNCFRFLGRDYLTLEYQQDKRETNGDDSYINDDNVSDDVVMAVAVAVVLVTVMTTTGMAAAGAKTPTLLIMAPTAVTILVIVIMVTMILMTWKYR